jgi:hypothetical protein
MLTLEAVLFASLVLQWVTYRDNAGTQTSTDNERSVAVERSVVIRHSSNRGTEASSSRRTNKDITVIDVEEEIDMAIFSKK